MAGFFLSVSQYCRNCKSDSSSETGHARQRRCYCGPSI